VIRLSILAVAQQRSYDRGFDTADLKDAKALLDELDNSPGV
jgi:hypothetical protein